MEAVWMHGCLPRVADWFERAQSRDTFQAAIRSWVPQSLQDEMYANGQHSWPALTLILSL